jgi:hypothetical protein
MLAAIQLKHAGQAAYVFNAEIPHLFSNSKVHNHAHKTPQLNFMHTELKPVSITINNFFVR